MFCLSNLSSVSKTLAQANLPQTNSSSSSSSPPLRSNDPNPKPPLGSSKSISLPRRKKRNPSPPPPRPTVIQIERIVGAGSFRDGQPGFVLDSDVRKSVFDLFLGKKFEGPVEKKMRETGEWLINNTEEDFRSSGKRILMFVFQWLLPVWAISLLIASGVIKLPFTTPFLDDLLM
ncbi:putative NAD(P)H dehydrogenase subunit CRR3, chloroplastic [Senna tora]|uniref:Putative NAD(P)H dehydrogenase subunit CRR3, chloroplastic n=1 Tax=Senna tora TaxID=362788 RepID=A0A834W4W6_9FABA|nr:putative NAD(P)H dehydrogenase subunit CRR3, chloroplastic [Senna tora]